MSAAWLSSRNTAVTPGKPVTTDAAAAADVVPVLLVHN